MAPKKMLTIKQIQDEYGISRKHIDQAIHGGYLESFRFGNKTKFVKRVDLEKWIELHRLEKGREVLIRAGRL